MLGQFGQVKLARAILLVLLAVHVDPACAGLQPEKEPQATPLEVEAEKEAARFQIFQLAVACVLQVVIQFFVDGDPLEVGPQKEYRISELMLHKVVQSNAGQGATLALGIYEVRYTRPYMQRYRPGTYM